MAYVISTTQRNLIEYLYNISFNFADCTSAVIWSWWLHSHGSAVSDPWFPLYWYKHFISHVLIMRSFTNPNTNRRVNGEVSGWTKRSDPVPFFLIQLLVGLRKSSYSSWRLFFLAWPSSSATLESSSLFDRPRPSLTDGISSKLSSRCSRWEAAEVVLPGSTNYWIRRTWNLLLVYDPRQGSEESFLVRWRDVGWSYHLTIPEEELQTSFPANRRKHPSSSLAVNHNK